LELVDLQGQRSRVGGREHGVVGAKRDAGDIATLYRDEGKVDNLLQGGQNRRRRKQRACNARERTRQFPYGSSTVLRNSLKVAASRGTWLLIAYVDALDIDCRRRGLLDVQLDSLGIGLDLASWRPCEPAHGEPTTATLKAVMVDPGRGQRLIRQP